MKKIKLPFKLSFFTWCGRAWVNILTFKRAKKVRLNYLIKVLQAQRRECTIVSLVNRDISYPYWDRRNLEKNPEKKPVCRSLFTRSIVYGKSVMILLSLARCLLREIFQTIQKNILSSRMNLFFVYRWKVGVKSITSAELF